MGDDGQSYGSLDGLLSLFSVTESELERVRAYGGRFVLPSMERYLDLFYAWLGQQPDWMLSEAEMASARIAQSQYWREFFVCQLSEKYLESRRLTAAGYVEEGLGLYAYLSAVSKSLDLFLVDLYDGSLSERDYIEASRAVIHLARLDTAIVVQSFSERLAADRESQSRALMAMSTPITTVWDGLLMVPVVGIIDSRRARDIMVAMLNAIDTTRARVIILDISGVAIVDTAVANHLLKITKATQLMGCPCILSGLSPEIAQTMVELGIDLTGISTTATLRDALDEAFRLTDVEVVSCAYDTEEA